MSYIRNPESIEQESMRIIRNQLQLSWPEKELPVVQRLIHTSGDISLEGAIAIHPKAIEAGLQALAGGADVITDVEMVRTGISQKYMQQLKGKAECFLKDPRVPELAQAWGITRSMTAFRLHAAELPGSIVAIGNAPTALFEVLRLAEDPACRPALIIGIPVALSAPRKRKNCFGKDRSCPPLL